MEKKDLLLGLVALLIFYAILQSSASALLKFISSTALFSLLTEYYKKKYGFQTFFVFLLYRTKKGLLFLSNLAKKGAPFLKAMADASLAMAFGLSSLWLMKWLSLRNRILSLLTGYLLIALIAVVLMPLASSYFLSFSEIPSPSKVAVPSLVDAIIPAVAFLGGVVSAIVLITIKAAVFVLSQLYASMVSSTPIAVEQQATLILPGITISLFEGILALALVLIVHEGAHGALSLIGRVPLKSTGLVFFGSLPVGAFVEPDEEKLFKRPNNVQARTLVAGVGANIFTTLIISLLYVAFLLATSGYAVEGCYVVSGALPKGTVITAINGIEGCYLTIPKNSVVELSLLNESKITLISNEEGKLGVSAFPIGSTSTVRVYENPLINFIYHFLGLALALNLFVGLVNLIPIPLFDGDHLVRVFLGEGILYKVLRYSLLVAFILLLLPGILQ